MTNIKMAVDAIQRIFAGCVEKVCITSIYRQSNGKKVLMAFEARLFIHKLFSVLKKFLLLPVYLCGVFKKIPIDIYGAMFGFCEKVSFTLGWKMTIGTMSNRTGRVIIMGGESPALICHRVDVARLTILI
jgi:hypothetical protein